MYVCMHVAPLSASVLLSLCYIYIDRSRCASRATKVLSRSLHCSRNQSQRQRQRRSRSRSFCSLMTGAPSRPCCCRCRAAAAARLPRCPCWVPTRNGARVTARCGSGFRRQSSDTRPVKRLLLRLCSALPRLWPPPASSPHWKSSRVSRRRGMPALTSSPNANNASWR